MDFITIDSTNFQTGQVINDIKSAKWVERYREPGEFEIRCSPYDSIRTQLALGTLISHIDTRDVMMVETHEINEPEDGDPEMIITGRSLVAFFENRIASGTTLPQTDPTTNKDNVYEFAARVPENQLLVLIRAQITDGILGAADIVPNVTVQSTISTGAALEQIVVPRGQLSVEVTKLLEEIDCGIQVNRPAPGTTSALNFLLHQGVDKSDQVIFASQFGDLDSVRYFWSNREYKNSTLVIGKYTSKLIRNATATGLDMRIMVTDATDYDEKLIASPSNATKVDGILRHRGIIDLKKNRIQKVIEPTISANNRYNYRTHYNIGDLVYIQGNYGISEQMRVVEYAEFEDENGEVGIPTVKALT